MAVSTAGTNGSGVVIWRSVFKIDFLDTRIIPAELNSAGGRQQALCSDMHLWALVGCLTSAQQFSHRSFPGRTTSCHQVLHVSSCHSLSQLALTTYHNNLKAISS